MDMETLDVGLFKTFGEALAIGLLIGVERYKARTGGEKKQAGIRTFTTFALMGAVCALLPVAFTLVTLGALVVLLSLGYYRHSQESIGITTEVAALLTFWLGYIMHSHEPLAISVGIVLVILLASKRGLHDFVKEKISELELYDTLKFLAVVFVVFPLLPNENVGPYQFFNPTHIWMLIILVSTISYVGYILTRTLGNQGLVIGALIGGIISTTAVTASLAARARNNPGISKSCAIATVMANAVQFPRLLLLIWIVDQDMGVLMALPLIGMSIVGMLGAWILSKAAKETPPDLAPHGVIENPYSLMPAMKFGLFFVVVFLVTKVAVVHLGDNGIFFASGIAGLGDASAISLSIAELVSHGSLALGTAVGSVSLAILMNAAVKTILAWTNGGRQLGIWLGVGFTVMLGTGALLAVINLSLS